MAPRPGGPPGLQGLAGAKQGSDPAGLQHPGPSPCSRLPETPVTAPCPFPSGGWEEGLRPNPAPRCCSSGHLGAGPARATARRAGGGLRGAWRAAGAPGPPPPPPDVSPGGRELPHLALATPAGKHGTFQAHLRFPARRLLLLAAPRVVKLMGASHPNGPAGRSSAERAREQSPASRRGPGLCAAACAPPLRVPGTRRLACGLLFFMARLQPLFQTIPGAGPGRLGGGAAACSGRGGQSPFGLWEAFLQVLSRGRGRGA